METVASWDQNYPAKKQAAALDVASNRMPEPNIPAPNTQHEPNIETSAAQMLPNTATREPASTTPTPEAPPKFEDTEEIPQQGPKFDDTDPIVPDALSVSLPDNSAMKKFIEGNFQVYNAANAEKMKLPDQKEASTFLEALEAGWQMSTAGLGIRGKMPDVVLPEHADRAYRIANQIGSLAGDMPAMAAGGIFGGLAGGAAGTVELPVAGTVAGAVVGAGAGSFAMPAALRKIMIDHYTKGDIQTSGEFVDRLMATTWEMAKGGITGAATALTGGAASVIGPMAKISAELATMTTVGAAMEGHLPHAQDFIDGAIVIGGLHGVGTVSGKLRNIYAATGERPEAVIAAANSNPELKQQLLSHDMAQPELAQPTELKHVEMPSENGVPSKEKNIARNQLVPEDLSIQPPEPKEIERSDAEKEVLSKIGTEIEKPEPSAKDKFNEWYAKTVDWTDPLKAAYAAFKESTGKELTAEENPHIQARLFAGHIDFMRRILDDGVPDANGEFNGRGLNDIYKSVPNDDQAGFDAYSISKRALELHEKGITPWSDFNKEGAQEVVAAGKDKFEALHQARVKFMNDVMDYGVQKGVIDPHIAQASKEANQEYIPFNRIIAPDELTGEIGNSGKLIKKIEGSELDLKNPRVSMYQNAAAIIRRAEINDIRMKTLQNLSYEIPETGELKNDFVREVQLKDGQKIGKNQIAIFRAGKMSVLEGTPLVIDSLKRLEGDRTASDMVTKLAAQFSKSVRIGQVIDPGFGFRHFFRSALMSGVYSQTGQIPFFHSALSLGEFMKGESETYKNWLSDGGAVAGMDKLSEDYIDNGLQESDSKYPFLDKAWNVIKKPFEASEAFIKMTDNLSRFTEYKRALEQGNSRDMAAFLAREVTPDFAKVGLQRSALRTAVAFQGAHINSLDRMFQAFKEDTQGTILRMSALSGISAMMWYVNKDDEEVKSLPEYQKDLYWNFNVSRMFNSDYEKNAKIVGGIKMHEGTIFRLPKPWGPGILFGSGVERTLDAFSEKNPEAMKGFAKSLMDSVIPNVIPSMAAPVLDQMANKNLFTGRQLVNNEQQKMLPEMQYQPYTSETAKQLGKLISHVPFVRDIGPSSDPLASPAVIDNYIRGWTGIAGGWAVKIADAGLRQAGIVPKDTGLASVDQPLAEAPILNEFLTRFPSMKLQPVQDFYKNYDESQKVFNTVRADLKAGNITQATAIMSDHMSSEVKLDNIAKGISTARKTIDLIQKTPGISPVEKRQLVDGALFQIGSMAKMGNQLVNDFKKQVEQSTKNKGE